MYNFTDHCHQMEAQSQLINIISYHIKYMSSARNVHNIQFVVLAYLYIIIFVLIFSADTTDFVIVQFSFLKYCYFVFMCNME